MAVIQLITSSSPYLKRIDLTECRLLTNLTVQVIARLCSQLEELSLQGCGLVTDDAIEEVALHCTRLHRINIGHCQRAGDKSLEALLRASSRMTHLNPSSKVRTRNAQLTKLGVAGCRGITYSGLSAITEQLNAAGATEQDGYLQPRRSSLVSLNFTCPAVKTPTVENVNGLSVSTVTTTAASARTQSQASRFFCTLPVTLEEISIHDAYTLSHSDIITLVDQVGPGLKVLRLDHANAINSETLGHVLAVCPNLTVLSIPRASRLDDSGVVQLIGAKCADSLVELDLSACHSLTDGCLTALAKCTPASTRTSTLPENDKGKGIQEQPDPCLFPNLRRLDLSYNDKLTLGGIIPLVMSLRNLCALDVSFCGDGVTRSWSSTLESLRPILNPTSASSTMDSTGIDNLLGDAVIESDHSEDEESSSSSQQQYPPQQEQQLQFSPHMTSSTGVQPLPPQYGLSSQNLQRFMNGVAPLVNPSRLGLGRYVGPLLNRATSSNNIANTNNDIVPQHPQQYPGQGGTSLDRTPLGNRRRSSASSMTSSSSISSIMSSSSSGSSSSSSSMTSDCSSSSSSSGPKRITHLRRRSCSRILLADRLDVLENTPRRVGIAASFHLESWFTPQHQLQLQHLFQIQSQYQRDMQEIQAAATQAALSNQMLLNPQNANGINGTGAGAAAANLFANSMPFAALSAEMMNHPVMTAIRVGAATVGGINNGGGPPAHGNGNGVDGGGGVGGAHGELHGAGGNNATSQNLFDSHINNNETTPPPVHHGNRRLSVTAGEGGPGAGAGNRAVGGGGVRHHHRHHYQHPHYHQHHRRSPLSSAATGHCEISAWGLIKLREEWAAVI
ncbi:RNI-like protein [Linnemannia elongata AG-77]|uniref:RNI-like protein n=1 Tax=Linnemannia elongata AG-77 TaxID=1314771 RepID=A0A197JHT4_9FUNG|nr:RNI-like protein [Linnemannia elongata AG-77]